METRIATSLDRINNISETNPESAIAALDSISPSTLRSADRQYYNLLAVKTADKAYIKHKSDSLINSVIKYYSNNRDREKYAEALYYGGRVTSDMGDIPTSLRHFQHAIAVIENNDIDSIKLLANLLSQTARLLNKIRLYNESKYYIKKVIEIDSITNDSLCLMYDLELLGNINAYHKKFEEADIAYHHALSISYSKNKDYAPHIKMYIAGLKRYEGKNDSALLFIREFQNL